MLELAGRIETGEMDQQLFLFRAKIKGVARPLRNPFEFNESYYPISSCEDLRHRSVVWGVKKILFPARMQAS